MHRMVRGRSLGMRTSGTEQSERGLYSARGSGIQKSQEGPHALRPRSLVVLRALNALVVQILFESPAFCEKRIAKSLDILDDARSFSRADVQPDPRARLDAHRLDETLEDEMVPPNGRRERGNLSENRAMFQPEIQRNQSTKRRPADARVLRAGKNTVFALHQRL